MLQNDPITPDDLGRVERRLDAGFQSVNARFITVDGRFAALADRLGKLDHERASVDRRTEARCAALERRLEATLTRADDLHADLESHLASQLTRAHHTLRRTFLLALTATLATTLLTLTTLLLLT